MDGTQKRIVHAILSYSISCSCNSGFPLTGTGLNKLPDNYLHSASELLSKIYHTSEISSISAESTNHYVVVYGLICRKLKDNITGHQKHSERWWNSATGIFVISALGMNKLRAIAELNSTCQMHHVSLRLKSGGRQAHAISVDDHTFSINVQTNSSNKFQAKTSIWQTYKGNNYTDKLQHISTSVFQ